MLNCFIPSPYSTVPWFRPVNRRVHSLVHGLSPNQRKISGIETQKSGTGRGHPIDEFDEALRLYKNCLSCTRHYLEEPNCIPELVLYNADPDDLNYKCGKFVYGEFIINKENQTRCENLYFCVF